jgi:hypothetical protein
MLCSLCQVNFTQANRAVRQPSKIRQWAMSGTRDRIDESLQARGRHAGLLGGTLFEHVKTGRQDLPLMSNLPEPI